MEEKKSHVLYSRLWYVYSVQLQVTNDQAFIIHSLISGGFCYLPFLFNSKWRVFEFWTVGGIKHIEYGTIVGHKDQ